MTKFLDKVPKPFLLGLALGCIIAVIALLVHSSILQARDRHPPEDDDPDHHHPLPPNEKVVQFYPEEARLGIYGKAAVSSDAKPCAQVGVDILRRNGTAVDAALAAEICASVVHPMSHGVGGGFIMTFYKRSERQAYSLMARETAPAAAHKNMYKDKKGSSRYGGLAIAIPGEVHGLYEAKERFGNPALSMFDILEPSIKMCEKGIEVTKSCAKFIRDKAKTYGKNALWNATFSNPMTDDYFKEGELMKLPKLGTTLREIAKNKTAFYEGDLSKKILKDLKEAKSIITEEDFKNYKSLWGTPIDANLTNLGLRLYSSPPPASGAIVASILNILDQFNHTAKDFDHPVAFQRFVEAMKFGFGKRTQMGDWNDPSHNNSLTRLVHELTSEDYAHHIKDDICDNCTSQEWRAYGGEYSQVIDSGTSHISVLAENGDAVAITSTINTGFGSGVISPQTGIVFNNEMDDFSTPGLTNTYGIEPSEANLIEPGRRPVSSMSPTIMLDKDGDVKLVVGASGGPKIITGIAFTSMMHLWGGLNIKEATVMPRLHHQLLPMQVTYFPGTDEKVLHYLEDDVGHKLVELPKGSTGSVVQGIAVINKNIITAANDFRKSGHVAGY